MLFTAAELSDFLHGPVTPEAAVSVERVVWGWLKPVLGVSARPDPVPAEVWSWAIELGAIAHENPAGLTLYQLGTERSQFSAERRGAILAEASDEGVSGSGSPRGSFPPPLAWPDPIQ
ncbi:MAG: hypothetical protein ACR2JO_08055 [Mycobacteriales bacterium]